jgi:hypothetical protein
MRVGQFDRFFGESFSTENTEGTENTEQKNQF